MVSGFVPPNFWMVGSMGRGMGDGFGRLGRASRRGVGMGMEGMGEAKGY